jgi:signal transduction histidine kinase
LGAISGVIETADGGLWLNEMRGIVHFPPEEVRQFIADPNYSVKGRRFDYLDGLPGKPRMDFTVSTAVETSDGRLWFAADHGLGVIDPAHFFKNVVPPPVSIVSISNEKDRQPISNSIKFPAGTHAVEIDYTALSFSIPERVRFRYKLEDVNAAWQDAGTRRQAYYNNLGPGRYRFRVIACNNDGVWNEEGASLDFTIAPAFDQTAWFRALCILAAGGVVWALYWLRMRQATTRLHQRLGARLEERERIARELHDTFFQGIQGLLLCFHTATSQLRKDEPARRIFEETLKQSDQVMLEGRELVLDMRATASEPTDLPTAIADFGEEMRKGGSCDFRVVVNGSIRSLNPVVFEELFKIGKEALGNAFRHSGAHSIEAELNYERSELRIRMRDDGQGIESSILRQGHRDGHFGLPGMRERAQRIGAHLDVWSRSGAGSEVELRIPADVAYVSEPNGSWLWKLRRLWRGANQEGGPPEKGHAPS